MIDRFAPAKVLFGLSMLVVSAGCAAAQTVEPDETVTPDGAMVPRLALTADQQNSIFNAVMRQGIKPATRDIPPAIGAPVPQPANLPELPLQQDLTFDGASILKYAMLERDIIVVDPVRMRVVAIIRGRTQP
jgi:hypothetical protein